MTMNTSERVEELIKWADRNQPLDPEVNNRNVFDRLFRQFVEWSEKHPELFDVDDKDNV